MNKKVLAVILTVAMLVLLLAGCGGKDAKQGDKKAEGAKYTFRLAETHPPEHPTAQADKEFAKLVAERSNG
ncbi:MAG: TRAP transporter substrate-binding protein, partial [Negativicutes bacterium]|nr:TRAP transporter substrate-binding protein [Negativicutes bacterium]